MGIFKRFGGILILLALLVSFASAQEEDVYTFSNVNFNLKDANTDSPLASVPVRVNLINLDTDTDVSFIERLDTEGSFVKKLSPGPWLASLSIDIPSTDEVDFFGELVFSVGKDETENQHDVYLISVGSIEGFVFDDVGSLVPEADLQFICKSSFKVDYPQKTDRSGFFSKQIVPVGVCKISAVDGNSVGRTEIAIKEGELSSVSITLTQNVGPLSSLWVAAVFVAAFIIVISIIVGKTIKRRKKGAVTEVTSIEVDTSAEGEDEAVVNIVQSAESEINLRAKDILNTLGDREKEVVEFLLANDTKSTQAKIRNDTGIPKTSLARILQTLEAKKVLTVETIGKLKKVELTDWFLGKE